MTLPPLKNLLSKFKKRSPASTLNLSEAPTPQEPKPPVTCPECGKPADGLDDEHCQEHWEALCDKAWWDEVEALGQAGHEVL